MTDLFENTDDLFQILIAKYPGSEYDLRRLIGRVLMDSRNGISRVFSDMEVALPRQCQTGDKSEA
jgi:hypothetical protein